MLEFNKSDGVLKRVVVVLIDNYRYFGIYGFEKFIVKGLGMYNLVIIYFKRFCNCEFFLFVYEI